MAFERLLGVCEFHDISESHYEWICRLINYQHHFIKGWDFQFPPSFEPPKGLCYEEITQNAVVMLPMGHVVLLGV